MIPSAATVARILLGAAAAMASAASPALAHTGMGATGGLAAGMAHPIAGLDHVLAMVTVGLLASQLGGRARWLLPTTFVLVMALAGVAGTSGIDLPFTEIGIALSVVVLGAAVALHLRAPVAVAMALTGVFAVFHGHAHGGEMPENAAGLAYGLGFMLATAGLHAIGIGLGVMASRMAQVRGVLAVRGAGAAIAVAGLALLVG